MAGLGCPAQGTGALGEEDGEAVPPHLEVHP